MGTGEDSTPYKPFKPPSSTQEVPIAPSYADWSSCVQAYYGAGGTAPPFFTSTVASPTPHPYMWGSQHPLISPYGTPVPYPAMYTPGGIYAYPGMTTTAGVAQTNMALEGNGSEGKDRDSAKNSKGTSVTTGGKGGDSRKAASGSGNDRPSQSAESGNEGSSEASDENASQFNLVLADGASSRNNIHAPVTVKPVSSLPPTSLNIGIDLWNASPAGARAAKTRPNPPGSSIAVVPATLNADQWVPDECELKKQKRKQSNRESARRSRLRKQAECEELQRRVETLTNENHTLKEELQTLSEGCNKLTSENNSIKEELTRVFGRDAVAELEQSKPSTTNPSQNGEGPSSC